MTNDDKTLVERLRDESIVGMPMENEAADRIEAQAAEIETLKTMIFATGEAAAVNLRTAMERALEIERLREALRQIAAPAYVSVGTHKHMHLAWREIACRRIDIARDVLGETE